MDGHTEPDETLMLRYGQGDVGAFETLYARHRGPLFRYLRRQCGRRDVAEELFQDVWMGIINARERYDVRARFTTYLYRIAHNRVIDHVRRRTPEPAVDQQDPNVILDRLSANPGDDPERRAEATQQTERLVPLLEALPDEQREAFLIREEAGMGIAEIAEATGVGPETAKSRLRYAVAKLRQGLGTEP